MIIETKYNIGQKMWYIGNHKAVCGTICEISTSLCSIEYGYIETITYYTMKRGGMYKDDKVEEKHLFPTKEELLNSL